jgi:hypothetical protein
MSSNIIEEIDIKLSDPWRLEENKMIKMLA